MITSLRFDRWKSFGRTSLPIDEFTLLVGLNASGKSNALDGLELLRRLAIGLDVEGAFRGDAGTPGIRGGRDWAAHRRGDRFGLGVTIESPVGTFDWDVEIAINGTARVASERLQRWPDEGAADAPRAMVYELKEDARWLEAASGNLVVRREGAQLWRLAAGHRPEDVDLAVALNAVQEALGRSLVLRPVPDAMRTYAPISPLLDTAAAATAGVLTEFDAEQQSLLRDLVSKYAGKLTGVAIEKVEAPTVGVNKSDVILVAHERWPDASFPVDARAMSDGTLRFLATAVALCYVPTGGLLAVDEVDDNIHPSKARLLLEMLREGGRRRGIDVLVTSQSSAMLDAADPELLSGLRVVTRGADGSSTVVSGEEMTGLTHALAGRSLGTLAEEGRLEHLANGESR